MRIYMRIYGNIASHIMNQSLGVMLSFFLAACQSLMMPSITSGLFTSFFYLTQLINVS